MSGLLIATNGATETRPAIEYGAWFAKTMRMKVTLLGVTENLGPAAIDDQHPLEDIFEEAVHLFKEMDLEYNLEIRNGEAERTIPEKANGRDYITVVSPLGRHQLKRWLSGRSIRPLMERIENPILYVPVSRLPVKKMLVSIGGLRYAEVAENLAFRVAAACQAEVSILHVVPPADLDYPSTRAVRDHLDDLAETDTLVGRGLRRAIELAAEMGLNAKSVAREGNIVEQILAEIRDGDYDIACLGSSYSTHSLRQLYSPNVTADVAEGAQCPILTARFYRS